MPRHKKNPNEKKDKPVPIKFSTDDLYKIREEAKKEHLAVSVFIRKVILDKLNHTTREK
jgi:predicted DNA binding CopG/RHH family protein